MILLYNVFYKMCACCHELKIYLSHSKPYCPLATTTLLCVRVYVLYVWV